MKTKREELKDMSRGLQNAVKNGVIKTVNEGLVAIYAADGHTEIHSYNQWKEQGYQVKRGSKALLLWGEPRNAGKQEKQEQKQDAENEKNGYEFYPLAYVFSQLQVEPIETAAMKK